MPYEIRPRSGVPSITIGPGETLDPYTDWDTTEGAPFSVISRVAKAIAERRGLPPGEVFGEILSSDDGETETLVDPASPLNSLTKISALRAPGAEPAPLPKDGNTDAAARPRRSITRLPLPPECVRRNLDTDRADTDVFDFLDVPPEHELHQDAVTGEMTITAVIDTALNLANARFRTPDAHGALCRSRIDFAWLQDAPSATNGSLYFGAERTRSDIEAVLARLADDDQSAMQDLGVTSEGYRDFDAARQAVSHGTHVLDRAAGEDPTHAKINSRIIAVQIPNLATADTSGSALYPLALSAFEYVFSRALAISIAAGRAVPLAVNFSYGLGAGPHDGGHPIEGAIRLLLRRYLAALDAALGLNGETDPIVAEVVLPSGNLRLSQAHAVFEAAAPDVTAELNWNLQPDDQSSNYLEVWALDGADLASLSMTPPGAQTPVTTGAMAEGDERELVCDGAVIGRLRLDTPYQVRSGSCRTLRLFIALAGTESDESAALCIPGVWQVRATFSGLSEGARVHAWLQRDDQALGYVTGARPSYLDDAAYEADRLTELGELRLHDVKTPATPIRRAANINGIATRGKDEPDSIERRIHIVGGKFECFDADLRPRDNVAPYSGDGEHNGPEAYECRVIEVDRLKSSDRSELRRGMLAAGTVSGSEVALAGTSVAAPAHARCLLKPHRPPPVSGA